MTEHPTASAAAGEASAAVERWLLSLAEIAPPRGEDALALAWKLVEELGHPQRAAPAVHIVGTAGKGTVASMLTAMVAPAHRVATHMSPHVYDIRERFLIDGGFPGDDALDAAFGEVRAAADHVARAEKRPPTFFAATAALSWVLGRNAGVDLFVTEAGIGGRLDATAVLDRPDTLTVVTTVALDHTEVLGDTVEEIAMEKAAVMVGRSHAILGPQNWAGAVRSIRSVAEAASVDLVEVETMSTRVDDLARETAVIVGEHLRDVFGLSVGQPSPVVAPGRYERRSLAARNVVLDGAHNPVKLGALGDMLHQDGPVRVAVVALGAAKDLDRCALMVAGLRCAVVVTEFGGPTPPASHRAEDVVAALGDRGVDARAEPDIAAAVQRAHAMTDAGDTILVTGSFMILADAVAAFAALG